MKIKFISGKRQGQESDFGGDKALCQWAVDRGRAEWVDEKETPKKAPARRKPAAKKEETEDKAESTAPESKD